MGRLWCPCHLREYATSFLLALGFEGDGMEERAFSAKEGWPVLGCQVWEAGTVAKKKKKTVPPPPGDREAEHRGVSRRTSRDCTPALNMGQRESGPSTQKVPNK